MNTPMINPDFLRTYIVLCEQESFTLAARQLHMTQPGVSRHLKWLEEYFTCQLVCRKGKSFLVTEKGKQVLQYAYRLFTEHEFFRNQIQWDNPREGLCRFASPGSFGMSMYSRLLSLNRRYPGLNIHYSYAPNKSIAKSVFEGDVDVGFVTSLVDRSKLDCIEFGCETLMLLVPAGFTFRGFRDLAELGFINHPDGYHHGNRLLRANFPEDFKDMGSVAEKGFMNQINRIAEPVAAGLGFTVLPEYACQFALKDHNVSIQDLPHKVSDPVSMIKKKGRMLPLRFSFLLEACKDLNQGL